jgi:hypothetical protein
MDSMTLAFAFTAAMAISAGVVLAFSRRIDEVLSRLIPGEMAGACEQYVKFALFTVSFAGGMRLTDVAAFVAQKPGQPALTAGQSLLEVFRTIAGSLVAASGLLLVFFASTLAAYAVLHLYQSHKPAKPVTDPRLIGAERHSGNGGRDAGAEARHSGSAPERG